MRDRINLAGREYQVRHTSPVYVHKNHPDLVIKIHQDIWDTGGFKYIPHIDFSTWTGTGGENGDSDSNTVAIFRIRKWHEVSKIV